MQFKFDKMVQVLEKYNYRVKMLSHRSSVGRLGTLIFDNRNKLYHSFFFIGFSETSAKTCNFKIMVDISTDDLISLKNCENIINEWQKAIQMCKELNSLNIPYLSNDVNDDLEYKIYFEKAYKKIGKRFVRELIG